MHRSREDHAELLQVAQGGPACTCQVGLQCLQDDTGRLGDIGCVDAIVIWIVRVVEALDMSEIVRGRSAIQ